MVPVKWSFDSAAMVVLVASLLLVPAARAADSHALGVQAGWWVAEIEYRTPFGVFVDVGVPYNTIALDQVERPRPIQAKLGYQLGLYKHLKLRAGFRMAWFGEGEHLFADVSCPPDNPDCGKLEVNLFSIELGLRLEFPCGFIGGVDIPVLTGYHFDSKDPYYLPVQVMFSQVYIGYEFRF